MNKEINWCNYNPSINEREYLLDAYDSGWVSTGKYNNLYELKLESIFKKSNKMLGVSNGTAALQLAFNTLDVKPGDEIIVPSFGFQAAANVLILMGAVPVFCDVDLVSFNQTFKHIHEKITKKTKGIVLIHNYGLPVKETIDICNFAKKNDLWVVEDCAEAWFSIINDDYVGSYGDIATWSTHAAKTLSTGEGGVVSINNSELVEKAIQIRSHGLVKADDNYLHKLPGNNYRMSNLHAAIGYAQIESFENIIKLRRFVNSTYYKFLSNKTNINLQTNDECLFKDLWAVAVLIPNKERSDVIDFMKKNNIDVRPGFYVHSTLPYGDESSHCNNSFDIYKNIIVLPCSYNLNEIEIKYICDNLVLGIQNARCL